MSELQAIMTGLAVTSGLLGWMGFKLNESESEVMQVLGTFFFTISLTFMLGMVWLAEQIAENTVPIDAYIGSAFVSLLNIMMWTFIVTILVLFFRVLYSGVMLLLKALQDASLVRQWREGRGGRVR